MPSNTKLWVEVTPSEHDHERAALAFIRDRFPSREPFRAWSNFTFIGEDGTRNEVDLLVVSPTGVYLVEIKSHPGRIDGDAGTWIWTAPDGRRRTFDNPLLLAERKAKKLKSLLMQQSSMSKRRGPSDGFYLRSVVFLSDPDLVVGLSEHGRTDVYGPDVEPGTEERHGQLPGLMRLFTRVDPRDGRQVDRPLSGDIARAVGAAGIRESTTHRRVGMYELGELLAEGEGWQDFAAVHPTMANTHRRIRLYLTGREHADEDRQALQRAAEREFRLLQGVEFPAIESPLDILPTERGPALVFRRDPEAQRLDLWMQDHGDRLTLSDRVALVRQLAEAVRHAHRNRLYHRALAAQHIVVSEHAGDVTLRIRDWQSATRTLGSNTSSSATGTEHVRDRIGSQAWVYLAPEVQTVPNPDPGLADMWSLGAVATFMLSGQPPAPDLHGLHELMRTNGALSLTSAMDAPPRDLEELIRATTRSEATDRLLSVDEFLEYLDAAAEEIGLGDRPDPLDAKRGDVLDGIWTVEKRVGSGRTSVVLLATYEGRSEILKVARSAEDAVRLGSEHEILRSLRDSTIIEPYGLEVIGGRTVLRLEPALTTLSHEIRQQGRLSLDLLERFGSDLLRAVAYLDQEGVAHRDIKPDNLGIAERGKDRERHLVLFDFSLSRTDLTEIRVGTTGYVDPFLGEREPRRWDLHAERYAVGVTLHEMATGSLPVWGDGSTDPALTELQTPTIDEDLFDSSVRRPLGEFFRQALARRPIDRFDTTADMQRAWERCFAGARGKMVNEAVVAIDDLDLRDVRGATPVAELGLSAKVRNALDRLDVVTAEDLAAIPPSELVRLSGIGAATRREITRLGQRLRDELELHIESRGDSASIDRIAEQLVPKPPADEDHRTVTAALLELTAAELTGPWPTQRDVEQLTGLDRRTVVDAIGSGRTRWKKRPDLTAIRTAMVEVLSRWRGIAGADELANVLLTMRGSLATDPVRMRRARAVVRAALEAESTLSNPRFLGRRTGPAYLVALDGALSTSEGTTEWDAERLVEGAAALGEAAEALAATEPLPSPELAVRRLRQVVLPESVGPFTDARLVRLAASAADAVAVSTRLELYPYGMDAARALRESRSVLLDRKGLQPSDVVARVRTRFPDAGPLPARPELDALLTPLGLEWNGRAYALPHRDRLFSTMASTGARTTSFATPDERAAAVRDLDHRLRRLADAGGFLVLSVDRRHYSGASRIVAGALGAPVLCLDRALIDAMRDKAQELAADWSALVKADAEPDSRGWTHLQRLVDMVVPDLMATMVSRPGSLVVEGIGLLARYGHAAGFLEKVRDEVTRGTGHALRAVVLIVPGDDPSALPVVDGVPVPVINANQYAHVPSAWLAHHDPAEDAA